ncbi:uncharacterized protein LOC127748901 [Frankliniella occidentalis]|uniref:Uncharacterized protein LOC127748901 n=1 Tax=Frankliniella occidentalis TaxID=133901 RepID=A0A9C6TQ87_FRAOC|nr:uncharacterized protein LOC127748901 [Frankliniella occidentalis]
MAEELSLLLSGWGLPEGVISRFVADDWTITSIKIITEEEILELIPTKGPRALFCYNLNLLKNPDKSANDQNLNDSDDDDNIRDNSSRAKRRKLDSARLQSIQDEPDVNEIHKLLKKTLPGLMILGYYKANQTLDHYTRDLLCTQLLFKELEDNFNKEFTRDEWSALADEIVTLFPTESKETWYDVVHSGNKSTVQGRLRYKYYSIRRGLISSLLVTTNSQELSSNNESTSFGDLGDDTEDEAFMWLLTNSEPWDQVEIKWEETRLRRKRHLHLCEYAHVYFEKFPLLRQPLGWKLIAADGQSEQPNLEFSLRELWVEYSVFLLNLIRQDQPSFLKGRKFSSLTADQQFVFILKELPSLFKVRTLPKSKKASSRDRAWRPSRAEVLDGVCLHVTEVAQIRERFEERKLRLLKYKYSVQPVPVFLGNLGSIRQCFIVMDETRWEVSDAFEAFMGCFHIAFGLGVQFPTEAKHIWVFLQKTLFNIDTASDYKNDRGLRSFIANRLKEYNLFTRK